MSDYDEATQTVAMDDGSRESIFEIESCPKCGGYLVRWIGGDGPDLTMCWNAIGSDPTCDVIAERWPASPLAPAAADGR